VPKNSVSIVKKLIPKKVTLIKRRWKSADGLAFAYCVRIWNPQIRKYAEITLRSPDENGAVGEAYEVYSQHAGDVNAGRDVSKRRSKLTAHIAEFLELQRSRASLKQITDKRVVVIEHYLKSLLEFSESNKNPQLDDLSKLHDQKFLGWRSKAKAKITGKKITNRTLNSEISTHRQFFVWAINNNLCSRPLISKDLKVERSNKPFPTEFYRKFISVGQKEIEKAISPKVKFDLMNYRTVVMVMNSIGCRVTEIKNMKWSDLIYKKDRTEIYIHGKAKERTIQIPERVVGHLENLKKFKEKMGRSFGWNENDYPYIFSSYKSKTVSVSFSNRTRRRWADKIGLKGDYDLVCFRHKFITDALNNGVHSLSVANYTGTSQAMIERTYSGLVSGDIFNLVFKNAPESSLSKQNPDWINRLVAD
jgi:site-specific recombinase XerD